MYYKIFKIS